MNRIIKFRVWDDDNKKWLDQVDKVTFSLNPDTGTFDIIDGSWEYQQFTGKLDRFGKEMFEGDIVQLKYSNSELGKGRYEIIFKDGSFIINTIEKNWFRHDSEDYHLDMLNICEVIGNRFENPELLKCPSTK